MTEPNAVPGSTGEAAAAVRPPLGMPAGSVRALVALSVFGTSMTQLVLGRVVDPTLWLVTIVVLLYYFAARQGAASEPSVASSGAGARRGPPPLWLPRGSVRALLFLGFAGTAGYLGWQWYESGTHPIDEAAFFPLLALCSFFLGVLFRGAFGVARFPLLDDGKALLALAAAAAVVVVYGLQVDFEGIEHVQRATLSFVIFYFSSR